MTRSSLHALSFGLFSALVALFVWLSFEGVARAQGSDACAVPTPLTTTDTGTTASAANDVSLVPLACNGIYTSVAGPDVFYEIVVGTGNAFTITVTPSATYDTSIYLLSACGQGTACAAGAGVDDNLEGQPEALTFTNLTPGTYFLGIDSFYPATDARSSGSYTVTIGGSLGVLPTTTTTVTSSPPTGVFGQSLTFTATVASPAGTPTGSVTFVVDGATQSPSAALNAAGQATLVTSSLSAGSHTIAANYPGAGSFEASTGSITLVVNPAATSSTLTVAPATSVTDQLVTLTATVSVLAPGAGTPGGTVSFADGATVLGTATLDSSGVAVLPWAFAPGAHSIVATYAGNTSFAGSSTSPVAETVTVANTSTTLVVSSNPSAVGQAVTLTAQVIVNVPGGGSPTGLVTFSNGATFLGTATLSASGQAVLTVSTLPTGTASITASYPGEPMVYNASTSAPFAEVVDANATIVTLASSANPAALGATVTFTATVASMGMSGPTGTVTFANGSTTLGSAPLVSGVATYSTSSLPGGSHTIIATYNGDAMFQGGSHASIVESITLAPSSTSLTAAPNPATSGSAVTFEAKVTSSVAGTPSGVVAFLDGTSLLGSATLASGAASFVMSSLTVGSHPVVAAYAGDSTFATSTSSQVIEKITASTSGDGGMPEAGTDSGADAGDAEARDAESGDAAHEHDGEAEKDAEGDAAHERDGEAEKDAESGDAAHKRDGAAEKDAESGDAHHKHDGAAEEDAETGDSGASSDSGSGGGCGCRVAENRAGQQGLFVLIGGVALAAACARRRTRRRPTA